MKGIMTRRTINELWECICSGAVEEFADLSVQLLFWSYKEDMQAYANDELTKMNIFMKEVANS